MGRVKVKVKEIGTVVSGATPSRFVPEYWNGKIDWITPKDIGKPGMKYVHEAPEKITEQGYQSCSATMLPIDSILFSSRAPIGHIAINKVPVCTNQGFKSIIPNQKTTAEYLYYCLVFLRDQIAALGTGSTFKEISKKVLEEFEIPLPPLSEQKRIASLLDTADALRQQNKALIAQYNQLAQSLFLEMFGDPVRNEKGWEVKTLGEVASEFKYGTNEVAGYDKPEGAIPILRIPNILEGSLSFEDLKYSQLSEQEEAKNILRKGDLLFVRTNGNPALIGRCAMFDSDFICGYASYLIRLRIDRIETAQPFYMAKALSMPSSRIELKKRATTTAGNYNINTDSIRAFKLPLPPLPLQEKFASLIENIEGQKSAAESALRESEALFQRLLQDSFS